MNSRTNSGKTSNKDVKFRNERDRVKLIKEDFNSELNSLLEMYKHINVFGELVVFNRLEDEIFSLARKKNKKRKSKT